MSTKTVPSIAIMPMMPHHVTLRMPNVHGGQPGDIEHRALYSLCHISLARRRSAGCVSGQNQPIMVMATGMAPMVMPHGVKMLPMNAAVVASAARNGQMVGAGNSSWPSGSASSVRVVRNERASSSRPTTTG